VPARLLVRHPDGKVEERPPQDLSELRDRPCWLDISDPQDRDLDLVAEELQLHPLALEDTRHRHQRPKIDEYESHYFIVAYALEETEPDVVVDKEISVFLAHNVVVTVHEGELLARQAVEKRFREGRLATCGLLLHALLDTIVDGYFDVVDRFGERIELLESLILDESTQGLRTSVSELFHLKRDLLRIRQRVAPEREVLGVLVRGDIRELREPGRRAYFQDVYDHILRVTDEIDTFRELTSNVIDAHLASASNRLNEILKALTSVATILLVVTLVTSFFGMNFEAIPFGEPGLFWAAIAAMLASTGLLAVYFRRRGWL
jgi:magnesium transporter